MKANAMNDGFDLGDDLQITKTTRRAAGTGTWVCGTIHGHRFEALVFPEHVEFLCAGLAESTYGI